MSRMSEAEKATTAAVQGLAPSKPVPPRAREPDLPTPAEREIVKGKLQSLKDVIGVTVVNPALEAARKIRQAEVDARRAAHEEHSRRMQYIVQGFEPIMVNGKTLSMSLARGIGLEFTKRKAAPAPEGGPL